VRRRTAVVGFSLVVGCGRGDASPPAPTASATTPAETWSFAPAAREDALTLPAPCSPMGPTLRGVVPRDARLLGAANGVGEVVVATSSSGRARLATMTMQSGLAPAEAWTDGPGLAAPLAVGSPWMLAGTSADGTRLALRRGPAHPIEELTQGEPLTLASARSTDGRAAVLVRSETGALTAFLGTAGTPAGQWNRLAVDLPGAGARLASLVDVRADEIVVAVDRASDVVWERIGARGSTTLGTLPFGGEVLAVALHEGRPTLLAATLGAIGGDGGTRLERAGMPTLILRGPIAARRGWLVPLEGGVLALWQGEPGTGEASLVHAAAVNDGGAIGPVTAVGEATDVSVASRGERLDVWLRDGAVVRHASAICQLTDRNPKEISP